MNLDLVLKTVEMARTLAELGERETACQWYIQAVTLSEGEMAEVLAEAGEYHLRFGDYKMAYGLLVKAFEQDYEQDGIFEALAQAFYYPNVGQMEKCYRHNVGALKKYPYLFEKSFPNFRDLTVKFFPFDEGEYLPYDLTRDSFDSLIKVGEPIIDRYFFRDLSKPLLLDEVYSQYHLTYLYDMVRKSEWYGGDNHIYLAYASFEQFCGYLQLLDFTDLLKDKKFVFLFGDQRVLCPLDFKKEFGIDYEAMTPKPLGVREVKKLIWHAQAYCHTGGDFFNEVLDGHPYLLMIPSNMYDGGNKLYNDCRVFCPADRFLDKEKIMDHLAGFLEFKGSGNLLPIMMRYLALVRGVTKKDWFVALWLAQAEIIGQIFDGRIVPAFYYQPHFPNVNTAVELGETGNVVRNNTYEILKKDPLFKQFKYLKSFIPMRRFTTSLGGAYRYAFNEVKDTENYEGLAYLYNHLEDVLVNKSYEVDRSLDLFREMMAVRFEDGKLNQRATFEALCRFLDIPWDDSLLTCTVNRVEKVYDVRGSVTKGFELHPVYNRYEDFLGEADLYNLEFLLYPRMKYYGYRPQFYQGAVHTITDVIQRFLDEMKIHQKQRELLEIQVNRDSEKMLWDYENDPITAEALIERVYNRQVQVGQIALLTAVQVCISTNPLVSPEGNPLTPVPLLQLDPALLERPLYE